MQNTTNLVTSITASSTNTQYPSAKAVYNELQLKANHDNVAKNFWYGTQAEYDALTTKDPTTIYMTDGIDQGDVYSTTEQRVGTWTDGKPVYQKVIENTVTLNNHAVVGTINNVKDTISVNWLVAPSDLGSFGRAGYLNSNYYTGIQAEINSSNVLTISIWGKEGTNGASTIVRVIVRYTKTTD